MKNMRNWRNLFGIKPVQILSRSFMILLLPSSWFPSLFSVVMLFYLFYQFLFQFPYF